MKKDLPHWLLSALEKHGIEQEDVWGDDERAFVRCDSFEEAFDVRHIAQQYTACHIAPRLIKGKPVVIISELNK